MTKILSSSVSTTPILVLLRKCKNVAEIKQIHAHIITNGLARFTFITSKILALYAVSQNGDINYAQAVFNQMPLPSSFDFNSMILGFSQNSLSQKGISLFARMNSIRIETNTHTFTSLLKCCFCLSLLDQVHCQILKYGYKSDVYINSSVISMYSKHGAVEYARQVFDESSDTNVVCWTSLISGCCINGLIDEAREMFDRMPERNEVSYSAMVSGFVRNGFFNEAIALFRELKICGNVRFNASLLVSVLNACAAIGAFQDGKCIHSYADMHGFSCELQIVDLFSRMQYKDVTTWSAMILGLAINGENHRGIGLFAEMERKGPKANAVTFMGVLTACNHKTLKIHTYVTRFSSYAEPKGLLGQQNRYRVGGEYSKLLLVYLSKRSNLIHAKDST
ncbi:pentatricopeptide repeat-containing protein, putative [Ricinus communis]|uniref:Pentatricopeptide repeat-containing protein, putative n=1 Tax=Ricinus communis TaxID=3988 RepID=B9SYG3_RICCO|nr:pentatricopeptide repeat-containing protein, putative [Ricinus communis]